MKINVGINIGGRNSGDSWRSYWTKMISAIVENTAPTNVVLTWATGKSSLTASDLSCTVNGSARAISSASWASGVWTVVLASAVAYGDAVIVTFAKTGQTKNITNNVLSYDFTLESTGTGAGVSTIRLNVSSNITLSLDGTAKFYSNSAGTLDESSTWEVASGAIRTYYLKCPSGTAKLHIPDVTKVTGFGTLGQWGWSSKTNAARLVGEISKFINAVYALGEGNTNLSGSIDLMTSLTLLDFETDNTIGGNVTGRSNFTKLRLRGSNILTGIISGMTSCQWLEVWGYNTLSGNPSGCTAMRYFDVRGYSNLTFTTVVNCTGLCYFQITNEKITEAVANQLLADFWANRNAAKSLANRTIDIRGSWESEAPSGQGLIDAANLRLYSSPTPPGTASLWTVLHRDLSIVYFGTSITYGTGASDSAHAYANLFAVAEGRTAVNYGVVGSRMIPYAVPDGSSMYERRTLIPQKSLSMKYLIFEYGVNDCHWSPFDAAKQAEFVTDYKAVINYALTKGWTVDEIKMLTCFYPSTGKPWETMNTLINQVGTALGVQVIDTGNNLYNEGDWSGFMGDLPHPNDAGHQRMSDYIVANIVAP